MMTCTHSNAKTIEQSAHIKMMNIAYEETYHGILMLRSSEETHSRYLFHLLHSIASKLLLVSKDVVKSKFGYIVKSCCKSVGCHIVWCTSLKLEWQLLESSLLKAYALYHLASSLIRRHFIEPFLFAIKYADTGRTIYLMSAKGKEVAV